MKKKRKVKLTKILLYKDIVKRSKESVFVYIPKGLYKRVSKLLKRDGIENVYPTEVIGNRFIFKLGSF